MIESLCGTTTPPEGSRNNTLYEAARQMAYLDGITEEELLDAFAPLHYLGLSRQEAQACIRSAMRHEKTWKYTLPPALTKAMEETPSNLPPKGDPLPASPSMGRSCRHRGGVIYTFSCHNSFNLSC